MSNFINLSKNPQKPQIFDADDITVVLPLLNEGKIALMHASIVPAPRVACADVGSVEDVVAVLTAAGRELVPLTADLFGGSRVEIHISPDVVNYVLINQQKSSIEVGVTGFPKGARNFGISDKEMQAFLDALKAAGKSLTQFGAGQLGENGIFYADPAAIDNVHDDGGGVQVNFPGNYSVRLRVEVTKEEFAQALGVADLEVFASQSKDIEKLENQWQGLVDSRRKALARDITASVKTLASAPKKPTPPNPK